MEKIYITGHRNPDLDSICGALAYGNLKNLIDPRSEYVPVRCSHLSEEVKQVLNSLEITPPPYMNNVNPKVEDVMLHSTERIEVTDSLREYAKGYNSDRPSAVPVFDHNVFAGLLTIDNIVKWLMESIREQDKLEQIPVPEIRELLSTEVLRVQKTDLYEDAKRMLETRGKRGLAVFSGEEYVGYVTQRCFMNTPRYKLILVDHNEPEQSIRGIETADVVEIIDHHRLNAVKTSMPLFVDSEPLGSSCTVIYQMYLRNGIRPDPQTAKTMLAGILADTVILKSPTTTRIDRESAYILSAICGMETEEFGRRMFSSIEGLKNRDPEEAISADFKQYREKGCHLGIGQCEVTTLHDLPDYCGRYLEALEEVRRKNGLDWATLMITDVLKEHSVLLSTEYRAEKHLQYQPLKPHVFNMPGVMSRKKQLLPEVLHAVGIG